MAHVCIVQGSPRSPSRSETIASHLARCLEEAGHGAEVITTRSLPAQALVQGDHEAPEIARAIASLEKAQALIAITPIYKAQAAGTLKVFLDLLPQEALANKGALAIASGAALAHALALDFAIKPIFFALAAESVFAGAFLLDGALPKKEGGYAIGDEAQQSLSRALAPFISWLKRR